MSRYPRFPGQTRHASRPADAALVDPARVAQAAAILARPDHVLTQRPGYLGGGVSYALSAPGHAAMTVLSETLRAAEREVARLPGLSP